METTKVSPKSADNSSFKMIDVSEKEITRRRARAQGKILLSPEAFLAIKNKTNPKGDVLSLAEVAGIMACKRTSDLIPLCHPLPLQSVQMTFTLLESENGVAVTCEAITSAQTGVEMEALVGVQGALLAIYDLSKIVNPAITITDVRLTFKEGGKSKYWSHPANRDDAVVEPAPKFLENLKVGVLTVSDRASAGKSEDLSGPAIRLVLESWGAEISASDIVADQKELIQRSVRKMVLESKLPLIIITGGTGLSPRDVTPEALEEIADRVIPGIGESLRKDGASHIATAWLSRSIGVLIGHSLVIALPGSKKAVLEGMETLKPLLSHALHVSTGGNHDSVR
jgi:cyclic pyranopterin phosphate synthase